MIGICGVFNTTSSSSKTVLLILLVIATADIVRSWSRFIVTYRLWFADGLLLGGIVAICCWSSAGRHYSSINRHEFHGHVRRVVWHPADLVWFVRLHLFSQLTWGRSWCAIDRWSTVWGASCRAILRCCGIFCCRTELGVICRGVGCGGLLVLARLLLQEVWQVAISACT